jgi:glycosyltransferase involved in cell wall biosynthesis
VKNCSEKFVGVPAVTVLMAVHNAAQFLKEAIDSVLNQTFQEFEFLVVNDGSTDATDEILCSYIDPRLRAIRLTENVGLAEALNVGIREARCGLIARMDGDDVCDPRRLAMQVAFLCEHPDVLLLGTGFVRTDADGKPFERVQYPTDDAVLQERLLDGNQFCHPSVMFRTDVARRLGGYRALAGGTAQDYDLWLRIAEQGKIANLPEMLLRYRSHESQTSVSKLVRQRQAAHLYLTLALQRRAGKAEDIDAAQQASDCTQPAVVQALRTDYLRWAERFAATGRRRLAIQMLSSAFRLDYKHPGVWSGLWRILAGEWGSSWPGKRVLWYSKRVAQWLRHGSVK